MCHISYPVSLMCSVPWGSWSLGTTSNPHHPSSFQLSLAMTTDSRWGEQRYTLPDLSLPGSQGWPCSFAKGTPTQHNSCYLLNFEESSLGVAVQFSHPVVSNSLRPHGLHHARPPCPSPTPKAYSNSCPLSQWWSPTISAFVSPFASRLQSCQASGSFPMSQVAKVLEFQFLHQSFQWIFRTNFL